MVAVPAEGGGILVRCGRFVLLCWHASRTTQRRSSARGGIAAVVGVCASNVPGFEHVENQAEFRSYLALATPRCLTEGADETIDIVIDLKIVGFDNGPKFGAFGGNGGVHFDERHRCVCVADKEERRQSTEEVGIHRQECLENLMYRVHTDCQRFDVSGRYEVGI